MTFVAELEPRALWGHFDQILTIPRGSKNEEKIRRYVLEVAERAGLAHQVDDAGNVVVRKDATAGYEIVPATILQSHLDMVQEKNSDVAHDFEKDPIQPRREDEYLNATGTTLGSDNGIGVAAMLAIAEADDIPHGPLELLFTIDEETGLTGAQNLDPEILRARRLINLDSEEEGSLCVGCAGGADSNLRLPLASSAAAPDSVALDLRLHGLKGGHSGVDIHLQRGNAIKLLVRALFSVGLATPFRLVRVEGGNAHNAVPREATATIAGGGDQKEALVAAINAEVEAIQKEFGPADPGIILEISDAQPVDQAWDETTAKTVLSLINSLPHGVLSMSYDIPGLVETSTNLATVVVRDGSMDIGLSSRSSVASALAALRQRIRAMAELAGAEVEEGNGYPGWKPDLDSTVLKVVREVHQSVLGSDPKVEAIHAGLECGLIGEMIPGMDMISFGPQIEFPHSPDERVHIDSVGRFWSLLTAVLKQLKESDAA